MVACSFGGELLEPPGFVSSVAKPIPSGAEPLGSFLEAHVFGPFFPALRKKIEKKQEEGTY